MDAIQTTSFASTTSTKQGPQISSDFETFLKMLTTQMQNQDPLNPIDSQDFAVQLATFSGVEQQVQTNTLLQGLEAQLSLMGMSQIANWVGMEARTSNAAHFEGQPIELHPDPTVGADRIELVVRNSGGEEVDRRSVDLSADSVVWNGIRHDGSYFPAGNYTFELANFAGGQHMSDMPIDHFATVREVRSSENGTVIVLSGGIEVPASGVTALRAATD